MKHTKMKTMLSVLKSKDPEDITTRDLNKLQARIEMSIRQTDELQAFYKELTGQDYVPPIRL